MSRAKEGDSPSDRMYDCKWFAQNWINTATDQDTVKRKRSLLLEETSEETNALINVYRGRIYEILLDAVKAKDTVHAAAASELTRFPKVKANLLTVPSVCEGVAKFLRSMGFVADSGQEAASPGQIDSKLASPDYVRKLFAQMDQVPPQVSREAMEIPSIARQLDSLAKSVFQLLFLWHFGHIIAQEYVVPPFKLLPLDFVQALRKVDLGTSTSQLWSFEMKLQKYVKVEQLRQHVCHRITVANHAQLAKDTQKVIEFVKYQGLVYQSDLMSKDASFASFEEKHWVPKELSALLEDQDLAKHKYFFTRLQSEEEFKTFLSSQWIDVRPKSESALLSPRESASKAESDEIRRQKQPKHLIQHGLWEDDSTYCETPTAVQEKRLRLIRGVDTGVDAALRIYQKKIKALLEEKGAKVELIQEEADTQLAKLNSTHG